MRREGCNLARAINGRWSPPPPPDAGVLVTMLSDLSVSDPVCRCHTGGGGRTKCIRSDENMGAEVAVEHFFAWHQGHIPAWRGWGWVAWFSGGGGGGGV